MAYVKGKGVQNFEEFFGGEQKSIVAEWQAVPAGHIHRLVIAVSNCAGAVSFGRTSDGGALTLYYLHSSVPQDKRKQYIAGNDNLAEEFLRHVEFWEGMAEEQVLSEPPKNGRKKR